MLGMQSGLQGLIKSLAILIVYIARRQTSLDKVRWRSSQGYQSHPVALKISLMRTVRWSRLYLLKTFHKLVVLMYTNNNNYYVHFLLLIKKNYIIFIAPLVCKFFLPPFFNISSPFSIHFLNFSVLSGGKIHYSLLGFVYLNFKISLI